MSSFNCFFVVVAATPVTHVWLISGPFHASRKSGTANKDRKRKVLMNKDLNKKVLLEKSIEKNYYEKTPTNQKSPTKNGLMGRGQQWKSHHKKSSTTEKFLAAKGGDLGVERLPAESAVMGLILSVQQRFSTSNFFLYVSLFFLNNLLSLHVNSSLLHLFLPLELCKLFTMALPLFKLNFLYQCHCFSLLSWNRRLG